tara:strand:- start:7 stop:735 length:729 start_codon:yes stop_codon:yes gene_type:complete
MKKKFTSLKKVRMSTTELSRILSRIETMETELAALRKQAQQVLKAHGAKVRSEADTAPKRVNGYTLYIKQGGKRDKWKELSDATKQKYAKQAKEMNEKVAKPRYVKALDKVVGLWNEDLQVYKAPKGRPPKDSVWDQDAGKYVKGGAKKKPVAVAEKKPAAVVKKSKCQHVFVRGGKVNKKGSVCGAKCTGDFCPLHAAQHLDDSSGSSGSSGSYDSYDSYDSSEESVELTKVQGVCSKEDA